MTASMTDLYKKMKSALQELDSCFAPQAEEMHRQLEELQRQYRQKQLERGEILKKAKVPTTERSSLSKERLSRLKNDILSEKTELNSRISGIRGEIAKISGEINGKSDTLAKLKRVIDELDKKKKALQHEIDERLLIVSIWKLLAGDSEKAELDGIEQTLGKKYNERKQILADIDTLDAELSETRNKLSAREKDLGNAKIRQTELERQLADVEVAMKVENDLELLLLEKSNLKRKIQATEKVIAAKKENSLQALERACREVRNRQPQLDQCEAHAFGMADAAPDMFAFGRLRVTSSDWHGHLPRLLPFPLKRGLRFDNSEESKDWINGFLLRAFQCLPAAHLSITVIDPLQLGQSLSAWKVLLQNGHPFPEQRFLTRSDEIESQLDSQLRYVEDLIQQVFTGEISDWREYNRHNPDNPLDYRLLIVFDLHEQLTDRSRLHLARLLEHGPKCGVLPLLAGDYSKLKDSKGQKLLDAIERFTWKNEDIYSHTSMTSALKSIACADEREALPNEKTTEAIAEGLTALFKKLCVFSRPADDLWKNIPLWSGDATDGLSIDIGWTTVGNKPVPFAIGGIRTKQHALLGGSTHTGKTNLLHILINGLCHKYSPLEFKLYFMDYKQAVEANIYADPLLPHAGLITTESDVDFGISVLRHMTDELKRRSELFKSAGTVTDYREFREKTKVPLPRILLIIDEFQELFWNDSEAASVAERSLAEFERLGRAFGMHLLLSTQTVRGLQIGSVNQLTSQLGCRIALECGEEDSTALLGISNTEAARLHSPPEGIINNENGSKYANIRLNIPFAPKNEILLPHLKMLAEEAVRRKFPAHGKVFNGNTPPVIPDANTFAENALSPGVPLLLGEHLDFEAAHFSINLKKENLLIAGYDPKIRCGLAASITRSICALPGEKTVILHQLHKDEDFFPEFHGLPFVEEKDASWDGAGLADLAANAPGEKFVIIDSLDLARAFQPTSSQYSYGPPTKKSGPSPYESLHSLLENTATNAVHVILFVESYRNFAYSSPGKGLFNLFDLRMGFGLDEEDAGKLISTEIGVKVKGLTQPHKAMFINRKRNQQTLIRPFAIQE